MYQCLRPSVLDVWRLSPVENKLTFLSFSIVYSRDCDEYTRKFYSEMSDFDDNIASQAKEAIPIDIETPQKKDQPLPPYNGFGTVEDSLGSCKYLVLKPPKKDFIKMLDNEHKILRFVARMVSLGSLRLTAVNLLTRSNIILFTRNPNTKRTKIDVLSLVIVSLMI